MSGKEPETGDTLKTLLPAIRELLGPILEVWLNRQEGPDARQLAREQVRMKRRLRRAVNQIRWLSALFFLLLVWNIVLTILLVL